MKPKEPIPKLGDMKMRLLLRALGLLAIILSVNLNSPAVAQGVGQRHHDPPSFMHRLTEDQQITLRELISQMQTEGATREKIHDAITAQLREWGIEPPEHFGKRQPFRHIMDRLNEEQKAIIQELISQMRKDGASREEIHSAVFAQLQAWNVELPRHGNGHGPWFRRIMRQLTHEQKAQVRQLIRELRQAHASREEIRQAIITIFEEFGYEVSGNNDLSVNESKIQAKNYPNPFNLQTQISYTLHEPADVQIQIYNIAGQLVRSYELGYQPHGRHSVSWDGYSQHSQTAPSGIYLYRISVGDQSIVKPMLLMK